MTYCPKCDIVIRGEKQCCPLCQGKTADVPQGKYRMDRLIYNDGGSREAPADRTWYLECAPWGEGMITALSSVDKKGTQTLRYLEYRKEGSGRWICRDEEDGTVTRLVWYRDSGTVEVSDADLTRHYISVGEAR